jgi:hypothetical protein
VCIAKGDKIKANEICGLFGAIGGTLHIDTRHFIDIDELDYLADRDLRQLLIICLGALLTHSIIIELSSASRCWV